MGVIQLEKFGVKGLNVGSSFKMDAVTTHTTFDIEHAAIFSYPFPNYGFTRGTDYQSNNCTYMIIVTSQANDIPIGSHVTLSNIPLVTSSVTFNSAWHTIHTLLNDDLSSTPGTSFTENITNADFNNKKFIVVDKGRQSNFAHIGRDANASVIDYSLRNNNDSDQYSQFEGSLTNSLDILGGETDRNKILVLGLGLHDYFPKEYYNNSNDNYWEDKAGWQSQDFGFDAPFLSAARYRPDQVRNAASMDGFSFTQPNVAPQRNRILGISSPVPIYFGPNDTVGGHVSNPTNMTVQRASNPTQDTLQKKVNNLLDNDPSRPGFDGAFTSSLGNKYLNEIYHRPLDPLGEIHPTMLDPIEERYAHIGHTNPQRSCRVMSAAEITRIATRTEANYFNITDPLGGMLGQFGAVWVEGWAYYGLQSVQQLGPFNLVGLFGAGNISINTVLMPNFGVGQGYIEYGSLKAGAAGQGHTNTNVPVGDLAANYVIITQEPPWPHQGGFPGARYVTGATNKNGVAIDYNQPHRMTQQLVGNTELRTASPTEQRDILDSQAPVINPETPTSPQHIPVQMKLGSYSTNDLDFADAYTYRKLPPLDDNRWVRLGFPIKKNPESMQLNVYGAYFHTGTPNNNVLGGYIGIPKPWPSYKYQFVSNPANDPYGSNVSNYFIEGQLPGGGFGELYTARPIQAGDPAYHWRSRQFRSQRLDAGMYGTTDFIYSAWYRKGPNGETMIWGAQIEHKDATKEWREYVDWQYEGTYRDNQNPDDIWCEIPNNSTDTNVLGAVQDPKTQFHDSPYAKIISGFLSDFNSGQNFSGVVTSPQIQMDGSTSQSAVTPSGGIIVEQNGVDVSYPFTPTGLAQCKSFLGVDGISYSRVGLGGKLNLDILNAAFLNFQNQGLTEVKNMQQMGTNTSAGGGKVHHINLNGNNLKLKNTDNTDCIPNFLHSNLNELYSFVCRDNHYIAPYATQQLKGAFPFLPAHMNRFEMAGPNVELSANSLDSIFYNGNLPLTFDSPAVHMACFEVTGAKNNIGTILPSMNPNMQRLSLRGTSITTVNAGWDPYELAELDLQNCALSKQSKINIIQGFANRRIAEVSLNTFSNPPYNHEVVTDQRHTLIPQVQPDEQVDTFFTPTFGGHNNQYTKDPVHHENGVFVFEKRDNDEEYKFPIIPIIDGSPGAVPEENAISFSHKIYKYIDAGDLGSYRNTNLNGRPMDVKRYDFKPGNFQYYRCHENGMGTLGDVIGRDDTDFIKGSLRLDLDGSLTSNFETRVLSKCKKVGGELMNQRHGNGTDEYGFANRFVLTTDNRNLQAWQFNYNPFAFVQNISTSDGEVVVGYFGYSESEGQFGAYTTPVAKLLSPPVYSYYTTISGYGPNTCLYDWDIDKLGDPFFGTVMQNGINTNGLSNGFEQKRTTIEDAGSVYPFSTGIPIEAEDSINFDYDTVGWESRPNNRNIVADGYGSGHYKDSNRIWKKYMNKEFTLPIAASPFNGQQNRGYAYQRPPKFSVIMRILLGGSEGYQFTESDLDEILPANPNGGSAQPTNFNTLRKQIRNLTRQGWEIELNVEKNDTINGLVGPTDTSSKSFDATFTPPTRFVPVSVATSFRIQNTPTQGYESSVGIINPDGVYARTPNAGPAVFGNTTYWIATHNNNLGPNYFVVISPEYHGFHSKYIWGYFYAGISSYFDLQLNRDPVEFEDIEKPWLANPDNFLLNVSAAVRNYFGDSTIANYTQLLKPFASTTTFTPIQGG